MEFRWGEHAKAPQQQVKVSILTTMMEESYLSWIDLGAVHPPQDERAMPN